MQTKSLSLSGKIQDKSSSSEFSSKQPLAEDHKDLKKFLAFAIDKMVETVKEEGKCTDMSQKVEAKLKQRYNFDGEGMTRLYNTVFWTLTSENRIISCDNDNKLGMIWVLSKENEEKIKVDKEKIVDEILGKYEEYISSNIKLHNLNLNPELQK